MSSQANMTCTKNIAYAFVSEKSEGFKAADTKGSPIHDNMTCTKNTAYAFVKEKNEGFKAPDTKGSPMHVYDYVAVK